MTVIESHINTKGESFQEPAAHNRALAIALLTALAQTANTAGFIWERWNNRR
jgi:hypothetical protein